MVTECANKYSVRRYLVNLTLEESDFLKIAVVEASRLVPEEQALQPKIYFNAKRAQIG